MTTGPQPYVEGGDGAFTCLRTGGKINVFLHITGVRPDGFHELSTLFLPLAGPCDELTLRPCAGSGLIVRCATADIDPVANTLTKAYRLYAEGTGWAPALEAELVKGIPHGAGLGGGSADAALVLRYLQGTNPTPMSSEELNALAARVGADVPFFLEGRPCLAEGIGERLTPCPPEWEVALRGLWIVLLCPRIKVATPWAYAAWDKAAQGCWHHHGDDETAHHGAGTLTVTGKPDKNHCSVFFWPLIVENSFESVVFAAYPQLVRFKGALLREGAVAAGLSGSGAALFGLFRDNGAASAAVGRLKDCETEFSVHGPFALWS